MQWTEQQRDAIESRGENLLVSAAAGSGKTAVLVARALALIESGVHVDEMLIVTFTRAAASDMREKLAARLGALAQSDERYQAEIDRLEYARISTLDAFCLYVIRQHFETAGVDPVFRVMDEQELSQLQARALEETLENAWREPSQALKRLDFGRGTAGVGALVTELSDFMQQRPDPEAWLREALYTLPHGDGSLWKEELRRAAAETLREAASALFYAVDLCDGPYGPAVYRETLQEEARRYLEWAGRDYDQLAGCDPQKGRSRLKALRLSADDPDAPLKKTVADAVKDLRTKAFKDVKTALSAMGSGEMALADLREDEDVFDALFSLTADYLDRLRALKAERSALTFNDMEHACLRALSNEGVAAGLRARFRAVFVDEYQDVSDLQEAILARISGPDNLFMVGDVKQSIYRFRQADPTLFLEKARLYRQGAGGRLIALRNNYRSRGSILSFVNDVFDAAMASEASEIAYDEQARLRQGARFAGVDPPCEVHIIDENENEEASKAETAEETQMELERLEREALLAVRTIRELLRTPCFDPNAIEPRPLQPGDVAVLARSHEALVVAERMLIDFGIPAYADAAENFLNTLEVRTALSFLRAVENRRRDYPLMESLRSPVGGFSTTDLARIRAALPQEGASFREAVDEYLLRDDELSGRLRAFENRIDRFRALKDLLPLSGWVSRLMDETGLYEAFGGMPGGRTRQANLTLLLHYAAQFDENQSGGLSGFLRAIDAMQERRQTPDAAHALGDGDDVVRLMTIHKSKGLQFPVVIGLDMGRAFSARKREGLALLDSRLGMGTEHHDLRLQSRRSTLPQRAIRARKKRESWNEELRVLYVMMTRAQHQLILIGSVKNREAAQRRYEMARRFRVRPLTALEATAPFAPAIHWEKKETPTPVEASDNRKTPWESAFQRARSANPEPLATAMRWTYPYHDQACLPVKLSASGLVRETVGAKEIPPLVERPRFLRGAGMTAAEMGVQTHAALSGIDLAGLRACPPEEMEAFVEREIERMLKIGLLAARVRPQLLCAFFRSDLGSRLLRAPEVRREWPFTFSTTAQQALGRGGDAPILVQGIVDCCFLEGDRWVLLDYKTDRADDPMMLAAHYRPQLALYRRALEAITGRPVLQAWLCLLRSGRNIEIPDG